MLTLVLFLIFCAYLVVRSFGGRTELTRRIGAVLAILGVADIPLVRVAVQRWRGNHPQVLRGEGGGITDEMQVALIAGFVAVTLVFATLFWLRVRIGFAEEDIETTWRAMQQREDRIEDTERLGQTGVPA
jgi:heme exporter protein C